MDNFLLIRTFDTMFYKCKIIVIVIMVRNSCQLLKHYNSMINI